MPRVYTRIPVADRFWSKVDKSGDCWLWTAGKELRMGYGRFWMEDTSVPSHRFAWEQANGPIPDGMFVCHRCDNPACVNPDHLLVGNHQDNMDDRESKGRNHPPVGEGHGMTYLTEHHVRAIRLYAPVIGQSALARHMGIPKSTIHNITKRNTWKHVT